MSDMSNYEINALRADAAAGEYDYTERPSQDYDVRAECVTTWADGYGIWRARIDFPERVDAGFLEQHYGRIRTKARRAIREELLARQAPMSLRPTRVYALPVVFDEVDLTGSITYVEKT